MKKIMKKMVTLVMLLMLVLVSLVGCGSAGSSKTTSTDASSKGVLKVGSDATFQPFEYVENDKYVGFDVDLIREVAKEMGYSDIEIVNTDFKGLIPGLTAQKFDVIASAMYVTDERKETINFSDSYYPGGLCIMTQKGNTSITKPEDLNGKTVSVQVGTKSVTYLESKYPAVKRIEVETNSEMFLQLESGKVDAVVTGRPAASVYAKTSGNVKILDAGLTEELYAYGLRKSDTKLMSDINAALTTLKSNGKYDQIKAKYFN